MDKARPIGSQPCPKCESVQVTYTYIIAKNVLSLTCGTCGYIWDTAPRDDTAPTVP